MAIGVIESVDPLTFNQGGGEITVTGEAGAFPLAENPFGASIALTAGGDDISLGEATTADEATLVFTVPAAVDPGAYRIQVFEAAVPENAALYESEDITITAALAASGTTTMQRVKIKDTVNVLQTLSGDHSGSITAAWPELDEFWPDGTTGSESDEYWCDIGRTVLTGANADLDLTSLADGPNGATIVFAEVRAVFVRNRSTNTTKLTILGSGATNPWTAWGAATLDVVIGSTFRYVSPVDGSLAVSGSSKVIRITNAAGATNTFDILIIGTSA